MIKRTYSMLFAAENFGFLVPVSTFCRVRIFEIMKKKSFLFETLKLHCLPLYFALE